MWYDVPFFYFVVRGGVDVFVVRGNLRAFSITSDAIILNYTKFIIIYESKKNMGH